MIKRVRGRGQPLRSSRLDPALGKAIIAAAQEVIDGKLDDQLRRCSV